MLGASCPWVVLVQNCDPACQDMPSHASCHAMQCRRNACRKITLTLLLGSAGVSGPHIATSPPLLQ